MPRLRPVAIGPASVTPALIARATEPRTAGLGIGLARVAIGVTAVAAPVPALRSLGIDGATGRRAATITRMAGVRDVALGAGTLVAARSGLVQPWLLAGAAADLGDVLVIGDALRRKQARGALVWAAAGSAVGAALAGLIAGSRRA